MSYKSTTFAPDFKTDRSELKRRREIDRKPFARPSLNLRLTFALRSLIRIAASRLRE